MYVAYVPDLAFDLLLLMTAHKQGVGFMTEDENFSHATEVARQSGFLILPHATDRARGVILLCLYHSSFCPSLASLSVCRAAALVVRVRLQLRIHRAAAVVSYGITLAYMRAVRVS